MNVEAILKENIIDAIQCLYGQSVNEKHVQLQKTRKEFEGDLTIVVFPFLRFSKKSPEQTANDLGEHLKANVDVVDGFNVIKGFLNIEVSCLYWLDFFNKALDTEKFGFVEPTVDSKHIMIEYSSPNTNKPLHLGHVRNNLLGFSVAEILKANGNNVVKVNLVNDRGIHICKSMLAWMKWGEGITPEKAGKKGDHLVGDYYVRFDKEYKKEIAELINQGMSEEEAKKKAPLLLEAQEMLRKWEAKDTEVNELWAMMNSWVYAGFDVTYKTMGVDFDKVYYESETYLLGKKIVLEGLEKGILIKKEDGSVWADLKNDKLDEKLLLRGDGTSVYMTQDIGTAHQRFSEFKIDDSVYVVGNEQIYHFQVLKIILKKLGYGWADNLTHLSYGMVELPEGKMKSREGTVVDADDLMQEMVDTARQMSQELGKLEGYSEEEKESIYNTIGMGALKYFILKVDPKKNMTFNPKESVDFNGNTGPFIQYSYARIQSILRKGKDQNIEVPDLIHTSFEINHKEKEIIKVILDFPAMLQEAGNNYSPALVSNYLYEMAREFNQYYHDFAILKAEDEDTIMFRLALTKMIGKVIESGMKLLGISVPQRM